MKHAGILLSAFLFSGAVCGAQTPSITSAIGTTTTYGQTFLIDVEGSNFATGAGLVVNGSTVPTYSPASGELQAYYKNTAGTNTQVSVAVINPAPGGESTVTNVPLTIPSPPASETDWITQVGQQTTSPAFPATHDSTLLFVNPQGKTVNLVVKAPAPADGAGTTNISTVAGDAYTTFQNAIASAITNKSGAITVQKGTYTFNTVGPNGGHIEFIGLSDVTINGQGSTLVFTQNKDGILIRQSQRIKLENFVIQYAIGPQMYFLGTIAYNSSTQLNELYAASGYAISAADTIGHLAQYVPSTSNFAQGNMTNGQPALTIPGTITATYNSSSGGFASSSFQNSAFVGQTFIVWEQTYGGVGIHIYDSTGPSQAQDVILDYITINSGPGMGINAYGLVRGLEIGYLQIVPSTSNLASISNDGVHLQYVGGDVYIHNSTIQNQGDDGTNFNNPVMPVTSGCSNTACTLGVGSRFAQEHDLIAFFDEGDNFVGAAYATSNPNISQISNTLTLSATPPSTSKWARDMNTVDQRTGFLYNTVQNCACHGVLMQTPDGRVQHNTFSNTSENAIRVLSNVATSFQEGTGGINVGIEDNTINNSGVDPLTYSGMFWSAISVYGPAYSTPLAKNLITSAPVNSYVTVSGNTVNTAQQGCITIASAANVSVSDNSCNNTNTYPVHAAPSIDIFDASYVNLTGNSRTEGAANRTGNISIDPNTTSNITGQTSY